MRALAGQAGTRVHADMANPLPITYSTAKPTLQPARLPEPVQQPQPPFSFHLPPPFTLCPPAFRQVLH